MEAADNSTQAPNLEWHPHEDPRYDSILGPACIAELVRLQNGDSADRLSFVADPREVHKRLYSELAPSSHPEYAGTYRGTANHVVCTRSVRAKDYRR